MKTATIDQYHILGTQSGHGVRVLYRGQTLYSVTGHASESLKMLKGALDYCHRTGFTRWVRLDRMGGYRKLQTDHRGA